MGWLHAEHLNGAIPSARLVAAVVDDAHREHLESSGIAPCPLIPTVEELVARADVDAVVVASPTSVHLEHITIAAERKKAIFAEKPIAGTVEEARQAHGIVSRAGIPFQIAFQRRYDPGYVKARDAIADGRIGMPEMFRGISCDRIPPVEYLRTSGGLFWDLGIHDFDAGRYLMADEIVAVNATGGVLVEPRLQEFNDVDYGIVTLRFRRGGLGVVQLAWRAPYGYDIRAEVHGSEGKVITEVDERYPTRVYSPAGIVGERHHLFVERFADAYKEELRSFVASVRAGIPPIPNAADALAACLVSDAATRSLQTGTWVTVESV
jgi:predicted dehydrogenase